MMMVVYKTDAEMLVAVELYMKLGRFWEPSIHEALRTMALRDSWKLCEDCKGAGCVACDRGWEIAGSKLNGYSYHKAK